MRWTESDLATLKSKSRVIVHKQDVHANEPRTNTGTESRAELEKRLDQKLTEHLTGIKTRSRKAQIALRGAKAAALRGNWAKTLQRQCEASRVIWPELEHRFHPARKWRFDCAWQHLKIAVEIEGGIWTRGRHTRGNGFLNDMQKYNEATRLGWRIFRFTPNQVKTGVALEYLKAVLDTEKDASLLLPLIGTAHLGE